MHRTPPFASARHHPASASSAVRTNLDRTDLLDLLHHWRSERYVHTVATTVDRYLFSSCFTGVEIEGIEEAKRRARAGERLVLVPNHQSEYD